MSLPSAKILWEKYSWFMTDFYGDFQDHIFQNIKTEYRNYGGWVIWVIFIRKYLWSLNGDSKTVRDTGTSSYRAYTVLYNFRENSNFTSIIRNISQASLFGKGMTLDFLAVRGPPPDNAICQNK